MQRSRTAVGIDIKTMHRLDHALVTSDSSESVAVMPTKRKSAIWTCVTWVEEKG
jgi:hypothetical protein